MKLVNKIHSNPQHIDSMVIGSGHTIMANYIPPSIPLTEFNEKFYEWCKPTPETIQQFGLFGDIDYNTYYPSLSADELQPKDDEFIEPMFRLLSSTIVSKNYNPTDFSKNGVLRASMNMLLGQTVNCDHETNIGNAIGSVSKVVWQDEYKDGSFTIPAGINGILKIDGKANPRIARGILMEPPSIHSNSVTVQFKWDKSHPNMEDNEFYSKLGTYDSKGQMVRRIVTEVVRYLETSLVSHGADVFAQKIGDDGKIINPNYAKRTWNSFSEYESDNQKQYFFSDFKENTKKDDTQEFNINEGQKTNIKNEKITMNLEEFIASLFEAGLLELAEGHEMTSKEVTDCIRTIVSDRASLSEKVGTLTEQVTNLTAEITTLKESKTNLETKVANLQELATVGTNHIASLRETVVNNYKKLKGDAVDELIIKMINSDTTGLATLESLNKEYSTQLEEKFPLTCSKCGSKEISRASSLQENNEGNGNSGEAKLTDVVDTQESLRNIYKSKIK